MSKNYKVIMYTRNNCPPCEEMGTYPSASAATKGYTYESITLSGYSKELGRPIGLAGYPWFVLQDRDISTDQISSTDDSSIVDSFLGGNQARFDILIESIGE